MLAYLTKKFNGKELMILITIQPWLKDYIGHSFTYNMAVKKACDLNNWENYSLIPKDCCLNALPSCWMKILSKDEMNENKSLYKKLTTQWKNISPYYYFFKKIEKKQKKIVVMMEQIGVAELSSFFVFLFLFRPKIKLLLLHRYSLRDMGKKKGFYLMMHYLLKWVLKNDNLILLSDSDLVSKSLSSYFKQKIEVLPIPHTEGDSEKEEKKEKYSLWWPGGATRIDKGLKYIDKLSYLLAHDNRKYKLFVADSAKQKINVNNNIIFIKSNLSAIEYNYYMKKMGLILLPYLAEEYYSRTSGIFVEAITAGSIPIVLEGTWMANELIKNDLTELIVDFTDSNLLQIFDVIIDSKEIKEKINKMKQAYLKYHSVGTYAARLNEIRS